jgi:diphthamide synthase (EF-2-diphthine--ammonia ligase)
MAEACQRAIDDDIQAIAFGDLFLRDVRTYREQQLISTGIEPLFPLWDIPTRELARAMIAGGLRAKLVCVDPRQLDPSFAGREFDTELLHDLPSTVDPCGERGEFHSCVYDGPMFSHPVELEPGEIVNRDGFIYADFKSHSERPQASCA